MHMRSIQRFSLVLLATLSVVARADDAAANDDGAQQGDDAYDQYYANNGVQNWDGFGAGDDSITYWTDYAILPKRCIV